MFKKIIDKALEVGFVDAEIIESVSDEVTISLFNGVIDKNFNGSDKTYTLKGIMNGKLAIYRFQKNNEDLTDKEIEEIVNKLKDNVSILNAKEECMIFGGSESYPVVEKINSDISQTSAEKKIALLKEAEKSAFAYDKRIEIIPYCQYVEERSSIKMVNSKGLNLEKSNEFCGIVFGTVAGESKENPNKQNGFEIKFANNFSEINAKEIAEKASKKALSMLGAEPIESGLYPVIIENESMGDLLNGFFSMFTGEAAIKHLTSLTDKLGEKIMDEKVTIVDDPLMAEAIEKEPFDSEGVATYKKEVVKDGVFKTFLHNLKTAKALNTTTTGNASLNGVRGMNFYVTAGTTIKEEMISKIDKGLLITDITGLHAGLNPISGDFSAQSSGFYIENGKIVKPVTLIVLSGNFLKMMSNIECIGSDLKVSYQGFGAPSIWFKNLSVSGK